MNLSDYLRILIRRGWIIVLAILLTAGSAYLFSKVQKPIYRATQKIRVAPARPDLGVESTLKALMNGYVARLDTDDRANEVIQSLHIDLLPEQLHGMVHPAADLNTLLINIDVDMGDPTMAVNVAQKYGELFVQWNLQENDPLRIDDRIKAELLGVPKPALFRPTTSVNVIAGALLGLLIGGIIVFALEYIDANVVRRSEDIERYLQLPVLGNLPHLE